jgi:hypothetical protein
VTKHRVDLYKTKQMLDDLREWPEKHDTHPFATEEAIKALTAGIDPIRPLLCPQGSGGWALVQSLGLRVVNDLGLLLSYSKRDKPLKSKERLTKDEPLIIGYIAMWFRDIRPALKMPGVPDRAADYDEVIEAGQSYPVLAKLMEMCCPNEMERKRHLKWILNLFERMRKQGELGKRKLIGYHDKALRYFAERIVETAQNAGCDVGDLLPQEPATIESQAIEVVQPSETVPGPKPDWHARLSECLADYRAYELRDIERLLGEEGLSTSFEWFLDRRVSYPAALLADGSNPKIVSLTDICKPGLRIALSDHRGSGTTTALLWLSNRYCREETAIEPVVLRIDARDYADAAANDLSVYAYLAEKVYGEERSAEESRKNFAETLGKAQAICLVDNLSRSPPEGQARIGRRLRRFAGVVFVAPWTTDEELAMIGGQDTVRAALEPLDEVEMRQFIIEFGIRATPDFDFDELLAQRLACDMPDIAALPLGLTALCEQVRLYRGDCVSVAQRFITELFVRSGKPAPEWGQECNALPPELGIPMRLTMPIYATARSESVPDDTLLTFEEAWVLGYLVEVLKEKWPDARTSPLLIQTGSQTYRFLNREIFGFLAAKVNVTEWAGQCPNYARDMFRQDIVGIVNRYYYTWLENDAKRP